MFADPFRCWAIAMSAMLMCIWAGLNSMSPAYAAGPVVKHPKNTIVLGRISNNPRKSHLRLSRLAGYLAERLRPLGIRQGKAVVVKNNNEMIRHLRLGQVDFLSETVMTALLLEKKTKAEIMLREWKKNAGWYWSVIFTHKKSNIKSLKNLRGKKVAFEDPGSTTGFLLPLAILRRHKISAVLLNNYRDPVPQDKVGFVFAENELNITAWVERMLVHAGAYSNRDWIGRGRSPLSMQKNLTLLYKSQPMVRSLFLARHGISSKLKNAIQKILLRMHKDRTGRRILKRYYKVKKYDLIKGDVKQSLNEARQYFQLIQDQFK